MADVVLGAGCVALVCVSLYAGLLEALCWATEVLLP